MPRRDRSLDALLDLHRQSFVVDKFVAQPRVYDHVHRGVGDEGRPYEFVSPGKLVEDFWMEVERILKMDEE